VSAPGSDRLRTRVGSAQKSDRLHRSTDSVAHPEALTACRRREESRYGPSVAEPTVRSWLTELGLERYAEAFEDNDVDVALLPELGEADLVTLGVRSLGHRKRILAAVRQGPPTVADSARGQARSGPTAGLVRALLERGFVLAEQIGEGGMGAVYRARQTSVDREVAIKLLRLADDAASIERFEREARAIAALSHPHSVRLYDFVNAAEGGAIVMEYVDGTSLSQLLSRTGPLGFERAAQILVQVLDALTEAHAKGLVHRDLKPSNVLLQSAPGYRDFARVLDFGLARWVSGDESRLTRTGAVAGTPRYLSPEQIRGDEVTLQTDLYAAGILLYEALAGKTPFEGDIDAALMVQHLSRVAPPLPDDVERPEEVDALLERLLAKSPALRPASAHAVRRELSSLLRAPAPRRASSSSSSTAALGVAPERRQVVVVDVGFAASAALGDEAEHARQLRCRAALADVRKRYDGWASSAGLAEQTWIFGAPVAHAEERRRALSAALDARDALAAVEATAARVGVAEGPCVAGAGPSPGERYTVVGAPLAEARRLRDAAPVGQVAVSRDLVDPQLYDWEPSDDPTSVRLQRVRATDRRGSSAELPFVGREAELDELDLALQRCARTGTGRIVVIAGEAGIGKSRLLDELERRAEASAVPTGRAQVFDFEVGEEHVTRQLVRDLLALPADTPNGADVLSKRLGEGALHAAQWPFLFHFLSIELSPPMQRVYDAMDDAARRRGYREMLAALLATLTARGPIVLMVEDLHWADDSTREAVEALSGVTRSHPVLLALTTRVEGEERWRACLAGQTVTRIELEPLTSADAEVLALALGGADDRRAAVVERAGGHPLFLTEMLRGAEQGELPPTVHGLIHTRLDRLPELDRAAVQVAAVLGPRAHIGQLRGVLDEPRYDPERLVEYRLVRTGDGEHFEFTHALVRDAVYDSLVDDRRRDLHARCAERLAGDPPVAAAHLERAGRPDAAASAHLEAARAARAVDRYEAARAHAARAFELAQPASDVARQALRLRGRVELILGDSDGSASSFGHLLEIATDDEDRYDAAVGRAEAFYIANRFDDALSALDAADAVAEAAARSGSRASYVRGRVGFATGRLAMCEAAHRRALGLAREEGDEELAARASSGLADSLYGLGRITSAREAYAECVDTATRASLLGVLAVNEPMLAITDCFLLELDRARREARASLERVTALSHVRGRTLAHGALSLASLYAEDFAEALVHADHARRLGRESATRVFEVNGHFYAARAALGMGDRALARHHAARALSGSRGGAMRFLGAAILALVARLEDDPEVRAAHLAEGAELVDGPTLSFSRFWFLEGAIDVALEQGDAEAARAHADALEAATRDEPFAWAERVIARGRGG